MTENSSEASEDLSVSPTDNERVMDSVERPAQARSEAPFGGLTPREAALRQVEGRRAKKAEREARAEEQALTFRQRLGMSLSQLTQAELDAVVQGLLHSGKAPDIHALARFADQAFGRPQDAQPAEVDSELPGTREERAAAWAAIIAQGRASMDASDPRGE